MRYAESFGDTQSLALGAELVDLYQSIPERHDLARLVKASSSDIDTDASIGQMSHQLREVDAPIREFLSEHSGKLVVARTLYSEHGFSGAYRRPVRYAHGFAVYDRQQGYGFITEKSHANTVADTYSRTEGWLHLGSSMNAPRTNRFVRVARPISSGMRAYVQLAITEMPANFQ